MANLRKLSTFRQLSLNCDPPSQRRRPLKIQLSEDLTCDLKKIRDRPPNNPIKIAWAEPIPEEEGVIAKKCVAEEKKCKLTRHASLEKDSILYPKQELAERLRLALEDREKSKKNLNIFLAHNTRDEDENELVETKFAQKIEPKIIPPLFNPSENNLKNIFHVRKKDSSYNPSKPTAAVVVIPIKQTDDSILPKSMDKVPLESSHSLKDDKGIKSVIIRPATAAAKRERFQKRTNSAFNSIVKEPSVIRPPLVRSSSAPARPLQNTKPKFLATKRKLKSGKRTNSRLTLTEEDSVDCNKENPKGKKEMNRHISVNGTEIVTMVSLVSPTASDNEELEIENPKSKESQVKTVPKKEEKVTHPPSMGKNVSLRKTVKSGRV